MKPRGRWPPSRHGRPFRGMGPSGGPLPAWLVAHSLHRKVLSFLLTAVAVGFVGGAAVHAAAASVLHVLCVLAALGLAVWPLAWITTFRLARPVVDLARVAHQLRGGQLEARGDLTTQGGEVGEVADALRGMADRVAGQLRDQRSLMAAVSHELRSPLARVRVLVELMRDGGAPDDAHDRLQAEIDGMDALVGDLLAAARIDFEAVAPRELEAGSVARRALELAQAPTDLLEVVGAPKVNADPTLLARALALLLDNAARHGGRPVALRVLGGSRHVRFEVLDDGPGFEPGQEIQAFQPFWRGPATTRRGEGLGLALVRQIAEAHGGAAGADNRVGGGALVWIELPGTSGGRSSAASSAPPSDGATEP